MLFLSDDIGDPTGERSEDGATVSEPEAELLDDTSRGTNERARLEGHADARPGPTGPLVVGPPPNVRVAHKIELTPVHGYVVDAGGKAVEGAVVYAVSKTDSPWGARPASHTRSDAQGKWSLSVQGLRGRWIGARAHGFLNTFVDGKTIETSSSLRIQMPDVERLRVLLLDAEGEPLPDEGIRVKPIPRSSFVPSYPGPHQRGQELFETTDAEGFATFSLDTRGPVIVAPSLEDAFTEPKERWLPRAEGTVTFHVRAGAVLKLELRNAGTDAIMLGDAWIELRDVETGKALDSARYQLYEGKLEEALSFATGWYDVAVYAKDREPLLLPNVRIGTKDDTPAHVASMRPLPKMGSLEMKFTFPGKAMKQQPRLFLRRNEAGWNRRWVPLVAGKWRGTEHVFEAPLRPGPYEIAASDVVHGIAGLRRVTVRAGQTTKARIDLGPGLRFKLYDVIPRDLEIRHIRVEIDGLGPFSAVGSARGVRISSDEGLEQFVASWGHLDPLLGPYPGDSATVHVTEWDGTTHAFPVR